MVSDSSSLSTFVGAQTIITFAALVPAHGHQTATAIMQAVNQGSAENALTLIDESGYRAYTPDDVRDAHLAHQLRRGGYLLNQISPLLAQVRAAGGVEPLEATLNDWRSRLNARSRAMLTGAAELGTYLTQHDASETLNMPT